MTPPPSPARNPADGRYSRWAVIRDSAIGLAGGTFAAVLGSLPSLATWVSAVFWVLVVVLLGFGAVAVVRGVSRVTAEADGLRVSGPLPRFVRWSGLQSLALRYYSTRKDNTNGWYQLVLADADQTIKVTSDLHGFEGIVVRATRCARGRGVALDATTMANLAALDIAEDAMRDERGDLTP